MRRLFLLKSSEEEEMFWRFSPILGAARKDGPGLNRISHPDWVKICGDPNGQIKLRAKQKYEVLSATDIS